MRYRGANSSSRREPPLWSGARFQRREHPASAAAPSNEICRMDAVTLAEKIRTKQLSATEVTEAVLGRMDKLNPVLGAFCTPSPDVARAQAKAIEADIMAGKTVGPLAGVPVGIKDLVYTKGSGPRLARSSTRTTCRPRMTWSSSG
jgi:Amidase